MSSVVRASSRVNRARHEAVAGYVPDAREQRIDRDDVVLSLEDTFLFLISFNGRGGEDGGREGKKNLAWKKKDSRGRA